jgi:hypothetical protein
MFSNFLPLICTLSYLLSERGEKHIWYKGFLYANCGKNQWRCPIGKCKGRLKTQGSFQDEQIVEESSEHNKCSGMTQEELKCNNRIQVMRDRVKSEIHTAPFTIYTEELANATSIDKLPTQVTGLYIKEYCHYKSSFSKSRSASKPCMF